MNSFEVVNNIKQGSQTVCCNRKTIRGSWKDYTFHYKNVHTSALQGLPTDDINNMVKSCILPDDIIWNADIPSHTEAVERHIMPVTDAAAVLVGAQDRDGLIRTTLQSRKQMPKMDTISQFASLNEK